MEISPVYQNLQARGQDELYTKPQSLCWDLLQSLHSAMSYYDWNPGIPSDSEPERQEVSWSMDTGIVSDAPVCRLLTLKCDLTWSLMIGVHTVFDLDLGIGAQLRTIVDLDNLLFVSSKLPLCHGFSVADTFESKTANGDILGRTEKWDEGGVQGAKRELIHRSVHCALVCKLTSHSSICLNCVEIQKKMNPEDKGGLGTLLNTNSETTSTSSPESKYLPLKKRGRKPKMEVKPPPPSVTLYKKYKCSKCAYSTDKTTHFRVHAACHGTTREFACDQCDYRGSTVQVLRNHKLRHSDARRFQCQLCDFTTKYHGCLSGHMKLHDNERPLKCLQCDFATKHRNSLTNHLLTHVDAKLLACELCSFRTKHSNSLRLHMRTHANYRPYKCPQCDFVAICSSNLKQHMSTHSDEKTFQCQKCDAAFKSSNALKFHYQAHLGLKPHVCKTCGKAFRQPGNLKRHYSTHTKEKRAYCEICDKHFTLRENLKRHKKLMHGEVTMHVNCSICHKSLSSEASLERHMSTVHRKERKHACSVCEKIYSSKSNLEKHVKCHTARELKKAAKAKAALQKIKTEPKTADIDMESSSVAVDAAGPLLVNQPNPGVHIVGGVMRNNKPQGRPSTTFRVPTLPGLGSPPAPLPSEQPQPQSLEPLQLDIKPLIQTPKKRGRPKKVTTEPVIKRRIGRPPKNQVSAIISKLLIHAQEYNQTKTPKRGRPKKTGKGSQKTTKLQPTPGKRVKRKSKLPVSSEASTITDLSSITVADPLVSPAKQESGPDQPKAAVTPKKRGRPPSAAKTKSNPTKQLSHTGLLTDDLNAIPKETDKKGPKKRGRPQKNKSGDIPAEGQFALLNGTNPADLVSASAIAQPPRKRGCRPKNLDPSELEPVNNKRARVSKAKVPKGPTEHPRKRGRPKKTLSVTVPVSEATKRKRRGRPPKIQAKTTDNYATGLRAYGDQSLNVFDTLEDGTMIGGRGGEEGSKDLIVVVQGTSGNMSDIRLVSAVSMEPEWLTVPMVTQHVIIETRPLEDENQAVIYVESEPEVVTMTARPQPSSENPIAMDPGSLVAVDNQQQQQHLPISFDLTSGALVTEADTAWGDIETSGNHTYVLQSEAVVNDIQMPSNTRISDLGSSQVNMPQVYIEIESMEEVSEGRRQTDGGATVDVSYTLDSERA